MDDNQIKVLLEEAIQVLFQRDIWLLSNDLSERSISHKLAEHLQQLFPNYHVDCEYNGAVDSPSDKKRILVLTNKLKRIKQLKRGGRADIEKQYTSKAVLPDIIVHKRGSNESNLCIIEIKKSTSRISCKYDFLKLESYTSHNHGNNLTYQLGVFIEFFTRQEEPGYRIIYFKNGQKLTKADNSKIMGFLPL